MYGAISLCLAGIIFGESVTEPSARAVALYSDVRSGLILEWAFSAGWNAIEARSTVWTLPM